MQECCRLPEPSRCFPGRLGAARAAPARQLKQGLRVISREIRSCWGKPDINSTLRRKSGSPGNPLRLLPLPHAPCCIPASCRSEGRSMSFSMPCLSSRRVPSHTSVSRLPAPCKLHSPCIPAARDTSLLPLPVWSTACGHAPGETTRRLMGVVLFSR